MECSFREEKDIFIGSISGRLDTATAGAFDQQFRKSYGNKNSSVVLDLSELSYVSSAGLRSLLVVAKTIAAAQKKFAIFGVQDTVREILAVSGFLRTFTLCATLEEAQAAVG